MDGVKRLDIKLGFSCNNNCLSCPQAHRKHLGDLSLEEIKRQLKEGHEEGANEAVLTGGEPTVREDILDIVAYARDIGYEHIQLQTNGRMLYYRPFVKRLVRAGITEFAPAIHGHTAKIHDYLTRSPGAFDQAVQGVRNLKDEGQYVLMNSVITKLNYRNLEGLVEMFASLGADQSQLAFIHAVGNAQENFDLLVPKKSEVMPYIHRTLDAGTDGRMTMMVEAYPYCFMKGYERFCSELYMPRADIRDAEGVLRDFDNVRKEAGKVKFPQCKECRFDPICEGPWKEYPERFGSKEFVPVPGKKVRSKEDILGKVRTESE